MCLNGRQALFCHGNVVSVDTTSCFVGGLNCSNERWAFGVGDLGIFIRLEYSTIAELSAARLIPRRGISGWWHLNAVLPQNVTSLSQSPCSSVHNIELSGRLGMLCMCEASQDEAEEMTATVVTQLGRPVALPAVDGFRGRLEKPVSHWLFTHRPVCKSSVCPNFIAFAQSHATAAS